MLATIYLFVDTDTILTTCNYSSTSIYPLSCLLHIVLSFKIYLVWSREGLPTQQTSAWSFSVRVSWVWFKYFDPPGPALNHCQPRVAVRDWLICWSNVPHWQPHSSLLTALSLTDWSLGAGGFSPALTETGLQSAQSAWITPAISTLNRLSLSHLGAGFYNK